MDEPNVPPPTSGDPIDWARASFDALRAEIRALTGAVARQQASLERAVQLDSDVAELARVLPERLGNAIAAAIEVRQDAFAADIGEVTNKLADTVGTLDGAMERTTAELDKNTDRLTTAARDAAISHQRVAEIADRTATNSDRITDLISSLPERLSELTEVARAEAEAVTGTVTSGVETLTARTGDTIATSLSSLTDSLEQRLTAVVDAVQSANASNLEQIGERVDGAVGAVAAGVEALPSRLETSFSALAERVAELVSDDSARTELVAALSEHREAMSTQMAELATNVGSGVAEVSGFLGRTDRSLAEALEANRRQLADFGDELAGLAPAVTTAATERISLAVDEVRSMAEELRSMSTIRFDAVDVTLRHNHEAVQAELGSRFEQLGQRLAELGSQMSAPASNGEAVAAPQLDRLVAQLDALADLGDKVARAEQIDGLTDALGRVRDATDGAARRDDLTALTDLVRRVSEQSEATASAEALASVASAVAAIREQVAATVSADHVEALSAAVTELRDAAGQSGRAELVAMRDSIGRLADNLGQGVTVSDLERLSREAAADRSAARDELNEQIRLSMAALGLDEAVRAVQQATAVPEAALGRIEAAIESLRSAIGSTDTAARDESLTELLRAVEAIPDRIGDPTPAFARLEEQVSGVTEAIQTDLLSDLDAKIEGFLAENRPGDSRAALSELTVRMTALTEQLAAIDSLATADHVDQVHDAIRDQLSQVEVPSALDRLERRLDELASRIPQLSEIEPDLSVVTDRLDEIRGDLAERIGRVVNEVETNRWPSATEMDGRFEDVIAHIRELGADLRATSPDGSAGEANDLQPILDAIDELSAPSFDLQPVLDAIAAIEAPATDLQPVLDAISSAEPVTAASDASGQVMDALADMALAVGRLEDAVVDLRPVVAERTDDSGDTEAPAATGSIDLDAVLVALDDLRGVALETGAKVANLPQQMHEVVELLEEPIDLDFSDMVEQLTISLTDAIRSSNGSAGAVDPAEGEKVLDRLDALANEVKAVARVVLDVRDAATAAAEADDAAAEADDGAADADDGAAEEAHSVLDELDELFETLATTTDIATVRSDVGAVLDDVGTVRDDLGVVRDGVGALGSELGEVTSGIGELTDGLGEVRGDVADIAERIEVLGQLVARLKREGARPVRTARKAKAS